MEVECVEIRSALWQRVFGVLLFGLMGLLGIAAILKAFWPEHIPLMNNHSETPIFLLISGLGVTLFSACCWWRIERYHLHADAEGMLQQNGFRTTSVLWRNVDSYRMEPLRGTVERLIEPVLYDGKGRVLLRPAAHLLRGSARQDKERAEFWRYVEHKLPGKRSGY